MSTLSEIKILRRLVDNLIRKVNCVCSRPNITPPPADGGNYYLRYNGTTKQYEWLPD